MSCVIIIFTFKTQLLYVCSKQQEHDYIQYIDIRYVVMCVTQVRMYGEFLSVNRGGRRTHDCTVTHKNSLFPHTSALRYPDSLRK